MRLSLPSRIKHTFASLQRHIRHTHDLIPQILKAVCSMIVVSLAFEPEFRAVADDELVIGVYGVVEAVESVGPAGFENGAFVNWVGDDGFPEHGVLLIVRD